MLRSLYSGISGLRSHQTMLDVTGNNIANVNTTGFKASAVVFQDTLSQITQGASGPQALAGGTNPAQVGLGVRLAAISTNFAQGSTQATGRATDVMIAGDGFFVTRQGGETLYTRAGSFDMDADGRLVTADGAMVQGWTAVGRQVVEAGAVGNITIPRSTVAPAQATTAMNMLGNLPDDAAVGLQLVRDIPAYDAAGVARSFSMTFTRSSTGWDVSGTDENGSTGATSLTFNDGVLAGGGTLAVGGISVDMSALTGYAGLTSAAVSKQDGLPAGTLSSFTIGKDGSVVGAFTNGSAQIIARIAVATFTNAGGLEKAGGTAYRTTLNSGVAAIGIAGSPGIGSLSTGSLEMSNVDLSQEFTNLIVAQRGFQANARIITTSDEVLQELTNLKR